MTSEGHVEAQRPPAYAGIRLDVRDGHGRCGVGPEEGYRGLSELHIDGAVGAGVLAGAGHRSAADLVPLRKLLLLPRRGVFRLRPRAAHGPPTCRRGGVLMNTVISSCPISSATTGAAAPSGRRRGSPCPLKASSSLKRMILSTAIASSLPGPLIVPCPLRRQRPVLLRGG